MLSWQLSCYKVNHIKLHLVPGNYKVYFEAHFWLENDVSA